jgi:hypothetical protein
MTGVVKHTDPSALPEYRPGQTDASVEWVNLNGGIVASIGKPDLTSVLTRARLERYRKYWDRPTVGVTEDQTHYFVQYDCSHFDSLPLQLKIDKETGRVREKGEGIRI